MHLSAAFFLVPSSLLLFFATGCASSVHPGDAGFASDGARGRYVQQPATLPFVDVCALAGHGSVLAAIDDQSTHIPLIGATSVSSLPFVVQMFGTQAAGALSVCSNGWLSLLDTMNANLSGEIPSPQEPNLVIAAYWTDLVVGSQGICFANTGSAPDRRFVVEWPDAIYFSHPDAHVRFEIVIEEAPAGQDNPIDLVYDDLSPLPAGQEPITSGLEDATGRDAVVATGVQSHASLRFVPQ